MREYIIHRVYQVSEDLNINSHTSTQVHVPPSTSFEQVTRNVQLNFGSLRASLVAQWVKRLPAMRETQVGSLGWEDPLQGGMTIHSNILAWRIPQTEEPTVHGVAKSQTQLSN